MWGVCGVCGVCWLDVRAMGRGEIQTRGEVSSLTANKDDALGGEMGVLDDNDNDDG